MPVSVIVGGQFGSEGKGKVAHFVAVRSGAAFAVRVGGPNAGHTVVDDHGKRFVFRQLPTASLLRGVTSVLPPGAVIDPDVLLNEIAALGLSPDVVRVDPNSTVITAADARREQELGLRSLVGSTLSGTGAAMQRRIGRSDARLAKDEPKLRPYLTRSAELLRDALRRAERIVIEGTQGFGLSLLHSRQYPYTTSHDTTAAACVSEAGLSPLDVDEIYLVIRAFPIRVAGNSGPLPNEIDWTTLTAESGSQEPLVELTTVTRRVRRVARFDPVVVREAITVNRPTHIVLNHLDYLDASARSAEGMADRIGQFVIDVEHAISSRVSLLGLGPAVLVDRKAAFRRVGANVS